MRLLIVDDHPFVLEGLAAAFRARGHEVVTARDLAAARRELVAGADACLLDYNLGIESADELLQDEAVELPGLTVVLSGMTEAEDIVDLLQQGVRAFVPKSVEPDDLVRLVETAPEDGAWVWDSTARRLRAAEEVFPRGTMLSPKERDVFRALRRGLLDKQIADELGLSIHTVRVHIRAIKRKRGQTRRAERHV